MVRFRMPVVLLALAALLAAGCGTSGGGGGGTRLSLVAYSTPREAYQALIPAFQKTQAGNGVSFSQSYGASGDQSRSVANGLAADVVALSLQPDMTKLVDAGLVAKDWNSDPYKGMVTDSVVALVVRKGNPKGIHTWDDLVKPGVQVITPNPFSSGGARWNVMAAYGAQVKAGKSDAQAIAYLEQLFRNVPVQDKSENPIAVVTKSSHQAQAKAFVDFLRSPQGQTVFAEKGYRPVNQQATGADRFPRPAGLFTIADLGGWDQVTKRFFDKGSGVMADVERKVGVSVGSS